MFLLNQIQSMPFCHFKWIWIGENIQLLIPLHEFFAYFPVDPIEFQRRVGKKWNFRLAYGFGCMQYILCMKCSFHFSLQKKTKNWNHKHKQTRVFMRADHSPKFETNTRAHAHQVKQFSFAHLECVLRMYAWIWNDFWSFLLPYIKWAELNVDFFL